MNAFKIFASVLSLIFLPLLSSANSPSKQGTVTGDFYDLCSSSHVSIALDTVSNCESTGTKYHICAQSYAEGNWMVNCANFRRGLLCKM